MRFSLTVFSLQPIHLNSYKLGKYMYDFAVIGAGVTGAGVARALSRYKGNVCLIEKTDDVSSGASKANSGIVHGGYAAKNGTLKGRLNVSGKR